MRELSSPPIQLHAGQKLPVRIEYASPGGPQEHIHLYWMSRSFDLRHVPQLFISDRGDRDRITIQDKVAVSRHTEIERTATENVDTNQPGNEVVGISQRVSKHRTGHARWFLKWAGRFFEFAFVQCWVQLFTAVAGMIVVRTLSKHEYTLFGIVNSMQSTASMMADLGIGIGITSIGGRVWHNRGAIR